MEQGIDSTVLDKTPILLNTVPIILCAAHQSGVIAKNRTDVEQSKALQKVLSQQGDETRQTAESDAAVPSWRVRDDALLTSLEGNLA